MIVFEWHVLSHIVLSQENLKWKTTFFHLKMVALSSRTFVLIKNYDKNVIGNYDQYESGELGSFIFLNFMPFETIGIPQL
jgi:hypothetical protein